MKAILLAILAATAEVWSADGGYQSTALYVDGGTAAPGTVLDPSGMACWCSSGSSCSVVNALGVTVPAPLGVTLYGGAIGPGCLPTPCVALWGAPSPFNPLCACPFSTPDGGRGC